jgi:hypothetical protein
MSKGKRTDPNGSILMKLRQAALSAVRFAAKHKAVFIPAAAGLLILILTLIIIFALGGNGEITPPEPSPAPSEEPVPSPSPPPEPSPSPEPPPVFAVNRLSGLPLADESVIDNRPVAVVHNNSHNPGGRQHALPMHGIGQADIIYETLAEGSITRMLAIYQDLSGIPKIGAVRSARSYFVELALAYDAVFVHVGGSPQAIRDIRNWRADVFNAMNQPSTHFWRDSSDRPGVSSEHTLFTSGERLLELFGRLSRQTVAEDHDNGLRFNAERFTEGSPAVSVRVPFTGNKSTSFAFDEDDGLYYVEQYNDKFIDGITGEQIAVTNLLVIKTAVSVIPGDAEGRRTIDLQSGGQGYYAAGGQVVPITWSREAHDAPFRYSDDAGNPLELLPGKTYVCIIPNNQTPVFE